MGGRNDSASQLHQCLPHLNVAFCSTGSSAGSICSVMSSMRRGRPTLMQFSKDLNSFAFVMVVTCTTNIGNNKVCVLIREPTWVGRVCSPYRDRPFRHTPACFLRCQGWLFLV